MIVKKVIRNGQVAVLYHPTYGAGWYSWHGIPDLIYDPLVVDMVESGVDPEKIYAYCNEHYTDTYHYFGGSDGLSIAWLPEGTEFRIEEYDGAETIRLKQDYTWMVA
jgi:hypothetical protein